MNQHVYLEILEDELQKTIEYYEFDTVHVNINKTMLDAILLN